MSPPPSCGLAVILLLQPEPAEIRTFLRKTRKPVQAEMAQANVMLSLLLELLVSFRRIL